SHAQTQSLVGFFVNSLPLRLLFDAGASVKELVDETHRIITEAKANQELPFEKLVDALQVMRDPSRHPLFQVMFSVQQFSGEGFEISSAPFSVVQLKEDDTLYSPAKYDLSLVLKDDQTIISGGINYAVALFEGQTIDRIREMFEQVLKGFVAGGQTVGDISVLSDSERHLLLHEWTNTDVEFDSHRTLHAIFEKQVAKSPDSTALVYEGMKMSYAELNRKANQLARTIRKSYRTNFGREPEKDELIALYLERGFDMIVSIFGVLKAGAAYVPVSPEYPEARIEYILKDSAAKLVISQPELENNLRDSLQKAALDAIILTPESWSGETNVENPDYGAASNHLAYVIYTSGTTGKPKGVMVEHRSVVNLAQYLRKSHGFEQDVKALYFSNYVFDASVYELFPILLAGSEMHIITNEQRTDNEELLRLINENQVRKAFMPTTLLNLLADELQASSLDTIGTGGDKLNILSCVPAEATFNQYGPTEATVMVTQNRINDRFDVGIGKPIQNTRLYVLNNQQKPAPVGCWGELYIGGAVLARGYLNLPEQTRKAFIENPFATAEDLEKGYSRLYRTGDMARWRADGSLEFLGRIDSQVKIRGYRIELGEIESTLLQVPGIHHAVVVPVDKGNGTRIAAYFIADSEAVYEAGDLRQALALHLPDYMIPDAFVRVETIPRTINDKIDLRALPEPDFDADGNYAAPTDELEEQLCQVWSEILGRDKVGIHDNFFHIGGDSIISIQLVSRLRKAGFVLQVKSVFKAPTVAGLAQLIREQEATQHYVTEQGILEGTFDLLPVQKWFFKQDFPKRNHWNQAFILNIPGEIQLPEIINATHELANQHDMLRCLFVETEDGYKQQYLATAAQTAIEPESLSIEGMDGMEIHELLTRKQAQFDILNGPVWRVIHLTGYADGSARLYFAFHHLIIDVVSWRIIAEDMQTLLTGGTLPAKGSSFRQWVGSVAKYAHENTDEKHYWQTVLADYVPLTAAGESRNKLLVLSAEWTDVLLHQANQGYNTEINDLLLSALAIALTKTLGNPVHHVFMEGHGREAIDETVDMSATVGWFTTLYPVRLKNEASVETTIIETKEMLRGIPFKGLGCGALLGDEMTGLSRIGFNYLGQIDNGSGNNAGQTWQIVNEDAGRMIHPENTDNLVINMTGMVQNGKLHISIVSTLQPGQTEALAEALETALISVIGQGQAMAASGGVKTPSDYGLKETSVAQLNRLKAKFNGVSKSEERENILEI
ncbi:MAG TPA: amino acid adenylation domain-containing protein, partial [Fluviicola sp.]|nr:amino acid adenylation domain-containing protein [Fluviicola sp.]